MQTTPANWGSIFAAPHKTEYRFVVNGVSYQGSDLKDTPVIKKPLLDKPALGRCCTGSAQFKIYPKGDIPKAATVDAYCRLRSADGNTVTSWLPQGKFYISTRSGKDVLQLNCLDRMIKAGTTYLDKTAFTTWPQTMAAVLNEICSIMGVTLDPRTEIKTGSGYSVDYPNEDTLISEILSGIAAAHGGNFIFTESGKLRLVVLASPAGDAAQILGKAHKGFTERGKLQTISRVILTDDADNQFTAGDDTGLTISAKCNYATQAIASTLCSAGGIPIENGCATIPGASFAKGLLRIPSGTVSKGKIDLVTASTLYGVTYQPYTLTNAYLDPAIELGDTISVTDRKGTVRKVIAYSITMNCTISGTCALAASIDGETEDEYPYITMQQLTMSRTLKTNQTYFGNRINRKEGFVSELLVNDVVQARMTANASIFSMQSRENGSWVDRIYFDNATGKYVITGDVTVQGLATFEQNLSTSGATIINGGNITTGVIQSHDGKLKFDLDNGTLSVNNKDLETALRAIDNTIEITATAQMFTKAQGATAYTPTTITLTAQSTNTLASYQWYKNNAAISGATSRTLTVRPADISGTSATYKVVGTDADGKTYTDVLSIAKLADGEPGSPGSPGAPGTPGADGEDSYTALLSNEYVEVPVDSKRKPVAAATYSCVVSVYKGLTALTATKNTPTSGQFKVTPGTTPTGVTVAQNTAGTITLTVEATKAIADSAELPLTITVYGGITVTTKITIHANMNNVTVQQQATIEANSSEILLRVRKDSVISEINQSAEEITISASKINLSGYVTFTNLSTSGETTIDGGNIKAGTITATQIAANTITGAKIAAQTIEAGNIKSDTITATQIAAKTITASEIATGTITATQIAASTITGAKIAANTIEASNIKAATITGAKIASQTIEAGNIKADTITGAQIAANTITASEIAANTITANEIAANTITGAQIAAGTITSANIKAGTIESGDIKAGAITATMITSGTLDCSNLTVKNLSASAITSGTLDASKITVKNLDVSNAHIQQVYAYGSNYVTVMKTSGTSTLYLGGDGSWNVSNVNIYASSSIQFGGYSSFSNGLTIDTSSKVLRPNSTSTYGGWSLGNTSYPFTNLYVNSARIGSSAYNGSVGFFGTTPQSRQTVATCSTSATTSQIITALNNCINALKKYGLFG